MVIASIPVLGNSKSIPQKNIKPLCGKLLVCWSIEALETCREMDKMIVAADPDEIEGVVVPRPYQKTEIYRHSTENISDTASTESVMLAYIHAASPIPDTCLILVQATSSMT